VINPNHRKLTLPNRKLPNIFRVWRTVKEKNKDRRGARAPSSKYSPEIGMGNVDIIGTILGQVGMYTVLEAC
jgi:hypothetical protein